MPAAFDSRSSASAFSAETGSRPEGSAPAARQRAAAPPPVIRYRGFAATASGREYTLSVAGEVRAPGEMAPARVFVVVIPHALFSSDEIRFQDAPNLCYSKLQRELAADAELEPGRPLSLTADELVDYRQSRQKGAPPRRAVSPIAQS
jgi:hypothetical protein